MPGKWNIRPPLPPCSLNSNVLPAVPSSSQSWLFNPLPHSQPDHERGRRRTKEGVTEVSNQMACVYAGMEVIVSVEQDIRELLKQSSKSRCAISCDVVPEFVLRVTSGNAYKTASGPTRRRASCRNERNSRAFKFRLR